MKLITLNLFQQIQLGNDVGHCREQFSVMYYQIYYLSMKQSNKEYYINDYGNQINNFVKSVFLRIRN